MAVRSINDIEAVLAAYDAYMMLERGLSDNTRSSYRDDIDKLVKYLAEEGKRRDA